MFTTSSKNSFKRALLAVLVLLASGSATAITIQGKVKTLDYEEAKGQLKQCLELPAQLGSTQQSYGGFLRLEVTQKRGSSTYTSQPIALTTNANILYFNELRFGYRYKIIFRNGFPVGIGDSYRRKLAKA